MNKLCKNTINNENKITNITTEQRIIEGVSIRAVTCSIPWRAGAWVTIVTRTAGKITTITSVVSAEITAVAVVRMVATNQVTAFPIIVTDSPEWHRLYTLITAVVKRISFITVTETIIAPSAGVIIATGRCVIIAVGTTSIVAIGTWVVIATTTAESAEHIGWIPTLGVTHTRKAKHVRAWNRIYNYCL